MKADAYICPSCGHEHIKQMGLPLAVGIVFIPLIFSWFSLKKEYSIKAKIASMSWLVISCFIVFSGQFSGNQNQTHSSSTAAAQSQESAPKQLEVIQNWEYTEDFDKMRNTTSYWATATSLETKNFGFPYTDVKQQIVLRQRPSDGFNILITLTHGQYSCGYDGCSINVKFDDGPIKKYSVTRASDLASGTLFIVNKSGFLSKLKQSSKVMIESDFFQHGPETFEINVLGLEWNH